MLAKTFTTMLLLIGVSIGVQATMLPEVKQATDDGKVAMVVFLKASWGFCQSQAAKLYKWYSLLGRDDFEIIIVNIVNQDDIFDTLKTLTNNEFTYVQDTPALNIWKNMNAKKDDIVIFKRDGTKKVHLSMSNKRKEIFLGPKDGASCEIVDQVQPIKHLLEALGDSGIPATCDLIISGSGSGDDFEIIEESSGSGSGEEEELTIEEMKEDIAIMVKELQAARKKLRQAIMKRKAMKKAEREAKREARKNKKEQRKKNKMGGKKMGGGKKMMGGNDKNLSMGGGAHDGH